MSTPVVTGIDRVKLIRGWVVGLAVIAVVLGVIGLLLPGPTLFAVAILFGVYLIVSGVHRVVTATADRRLSKVTDARKWLTPEDAFRIVRGRLVGTRTTVAFSFITDVRRHILEQSLAAQADG